MSEIPLKEYDDPKHGPYWRAAATRRLRKSGHWEGANARRLELKRQHGLQDEESWKRMIDEFPPDGEGGSEKVVVNRKVNPLIGVNLTSELRVDEIPNPVDCAHWAFNHLAGFRQKKVGQKDAPSAGAWLVLLWAHERFNEFMTWYTKLSLALARTKEEAWDVEYDRLDKFLETAKRISGGGGAMESPGSPDGGGKSELAKETSV